MMPPIRERGGRIAKMPPSIYFPTKPSCSHETRWRMSSLPSRKEKHATVSCPSRTPWLDRSIQDHSENYTRFLLITPSKSPEAAKAPAEDYKTTIVFSVGNVPGALYHSLRPFAERRIDLAKIESRPLRGSPFEYLFYLDLIGCADAKPVSDALHELRAQAKSVRVLGSYPRHRG